MNFLPTVPTPMLWMSGGIVSVLIIASLMVRILRWKKPGKDFTELSLRIRTWWIMVAVFLVAVLIHPSVTILMFTMMSYLALKEYLSLIPTRRADRRVLLWAYLSIPVQYWWIGSAWYGMFVLWIPLYMFLLIPLRMVLIGETRDFLKSAATIHWGLMTTVYSLSHVPGFITMKMRPESILPAGPAGMILFVVVCTQANDVAQYIWGKSLGKTKAVPTVSPGKTLEGLIGGVITTVALASVLGPLLTPLTLFQSAIAGLILGLGGFIGDITISALKRDLGVKDSGSMLPGHGGILDRIDSLTFTAPLIFHYIRFLHGLPDGLATK